jgi:hypothetical protein
MTVPAFRPDGPVLAGACGLQVAAVAEAAVATERAPATTMALERLT